MTIKANKVILKTYYNLDGDYILFEDNPLHNQSYDNVKVETKRVTRTVCGIEYTTDVVEIEGRKPIECELLSVFELDDMLIIKLCQDWG